MKPCFFALVLAIWLAQAHAQTNVQAPLTQKDVVQLLQLKTPENEIIEQIKKSGTVFVLGQEDIARLKRAGASEAVIAAMKGGEASAEADAAAFEITDLALVIDYSGSMNAKTKEGITKMAAAKEAVGKLIDKLPNDLNVAVVVYGVSKQRGCEDIDLVQQLGPVADKATLKSKLLGLANTGMTPIASSLEVAGVALQKAKGGRVIVLVTDGVESCKGDPAAIATKLASEFGVKFGLHVIGFDIKADERASLEQIAKNGHGKYFNADNATELASAMQKVTQSVATAPAQRESVNYEAAGETVKPGVWFDDAPQVQAGEMKGQLAFKEARYYKIPVAKGQELRAVALIKKTELKSTNHALDAPIRQDFIVTIYNPSLHPVAREEAKVVDNPTSPTTVRATWTAESDGIAYVSIASSANYDSWGKEGGGQAVELTEKNPVPSPYTLRLRTEGEAAAPSTPAEAPKVISVKAGNNYETAGTIPGSGMIVGDLKLGESAFYSMNVEKGDVLNVNVAAQKPWEPTQSISMRVIPEAAFKILIYDEDQVEAGKETFTIKNNPPDSKAGSLNWPVTLSGKAYLVVSVAKAGNNVEDAKKPSGPGRFALMVKKSGNAPAAVQPEASKAPEKKTDPFSGAEADGN